MRATRRPRKRKSNEEEILYGNHKIHRKKRSIKKNVCRNIPEPIRPSIMATLL
jgi:hypothetical protein